MLGDLLPESHRGEDTVDISMGPHLHVTKLCEGLEISVIQTVIVINSANCHRPQL